MNKNIIKNLLKISVAVGLIYWLVQSGKLDFKLFIELIKNPLSIFVAIAILQFDNFLVAVRLRIFLHQKTSEVLSLLKVFLSNWIGLFFNSVLPGAVTGDVVKIFYLKDLDQKLTKKYLLLTVFIDRVIGLMGLITVGGLTSILNYESLGKLSPDVKYISNLNIILFVLVILSVAFLFFLPQVPLIISKKLKFTPLLEKIFNKCDEIWNDLCLFRTKLLGLLGISIVIQALAVFAFWYLVHPFATGKELTLATTFSVMPIGFISLAIPIAPAGLGVGHVVFQNLLGFFGVTNGANLFNIYFFVMMFSNLTGVIPYMLYSGKNNEKVHFNQLNEMETEAES